MSPITHFLAGWAVSNAAALDRRSRLLVTLAGVLPDVDGLGVVADLLARDPSAPYAWYQRFHHAFGHNLLFALLVSGLAFLLAERKGVTAGLILASIHIHFLGDLIGSRGLEEDIWPVPYLLPFSPHELSWTGQWPLNGWQNIVLTAALLGVTLFWSWKRGYSPLELVSRKVDGSFVGILRKRFGEPREESTMST